jgi:hypothetical protein
MQAGMTLCFMLGNFFKNRIQVDHVSLSTVYQMLVLE